MSASMCNEPRSLGAMMSSSSVKVPVMRPNPSVRLVHVMSRICIVVSKYGRLTPPVSVKVDAVKWPATGRR